MLLHSPVSGWLQRRVDTFREQLGRFKQLVIFPRQNVFPDRLPHLQANKQTVVTRHDTGNKSLDTEL